MHAAQGLLLSTTARPDGASTQMDMAEAVAQLKGAERTAEALHDTLRQQAVPSLNANERLVALREAVDPDADGAYRGNVAGQPAMNPAPHTRQPRCAATSDGTAARRLMSQRDGLRAASTGRRLHPFVSWCVAQAATGYLRRRV